MQCVLVAPGIVSSQMVKYAMTITKESFVDIEGLVKVPPQAIKETSQQVKYLSVFVLFFPILL